MRTTLVFRYKDGTQVPETVTFNDIVFCQHCTRKVHKDDVGVHEDNCNEFKRKRRSN